MRPPSFLIRSTAASKPSRVAAAPTAHRPSARPPFWGVELRRPPRSAPPLCASRPRARKMAAAGRAWRFAALLPSWRLRVPCRSLYGAARGAAAAGGGRLLLGTAFALGGGAGLCLAARQRLREHSAAEVTRRQARRGKGWLGRRGAGLPSPWSARLPVARFRSGNGLK